MLLDSINTRICTEINDKNLTDVNVTFFKLTSIDIYCYVIFYQYTRLKMSFMSINVKAGKEKRYKGE